MQLLQTPFPHRYATGPPLPAIKKQKTQETQVISPSTCHDHPGGGVSDLLSKHAVRQAAHPLRAAAVVRSQGGGPEFPFVLRTVSFRSSLDWSSSRHGTVGDPGAKARTTQFKLFRPSVSVCCSNNQSVEVVCVWGANKATHPPIFYDVCRIAHVHKYIYICSSLACNQPMSTLGCLL